MLQTLLTSDCDGNDRPFLTGGKCAEGIIMFLEEEVEQAISRGLAYAPYCDLIWCETAKPAS
jgi:isocitrate lyase